jgi:hypothetical protein
VNIHADAFCETYASLTKQFEAARDLNFLTTSMITRFRSSLGELIMQELARRSVPGFTPTDDFDRRQLADWQDDFVHMILQAQDELRRQTSSSVDGDIDPKSTDLQECLPPINAEFVFYFFLDGPNCDAVVGDLEERYRRINERFGTARANCWYWKEAIRTTGPIAGSWAKTLVMKPVIGVLAWGMAKGLIGHDSWLAALVEMWKKIRS